MAAGETATQLPSGDLLALTEALVGIGSVSYHERELCDAIEAELRAVPWLSVHRVGDNLVARTELDRPQRLVLAGHLDTVPPTGNAVPEREGDRLWGLGSSDMKAGLAVCLELARTVEAPSVDVTYVFYAREEIAQIHSGLGELFAERPDLLVGDAALLGEPTGGALEAGCQGTMRFLVTVGGTRAHPARPWVGRNAIHRLAGILAMLSSYQERRPLLHGCQFREALQAVNVEGGISGNVVPDEARVTISYRFAPDRTPVEAEAHVLDVLAEWLDDDDSVEVVDMAPPAPPRLDHPLLASLVERNHLEVRAKLGWTDAARFAEHGIPAANFGPGTATVAHTSAEHVDREPLEAVFAALADLIRTTS